MAWIERWHLRRGHVVVLSVGLALLIAVGGAAAVALASTGVAERTTRLGDGFVQASPTIVADGTAGFEAVWIGADGPMAARRSNGRWSSAARLATSAQGPGDPPQLAAATNGAAVVAWRTREGLTAYARFRAGARARWQGLTTLAYAGRYGPDDPEAVVDARGDAYVLVGDVLDVHRVNASGWAPPRVLHGPGDIVSVAVTPRGTLALLRARTDAAPDRRRPPPGPGLPYRAALWLQTRTPAGQVRTIALGAQGGPPLQGDASPFLYRPVVATNQQGDILAAWQAPIGPNTWRTRVALVSGRSHRPPSIVTLREPGLDPAIAPGPHGSAVVLWDPAHADDDDDARAATIAATGRVQHDGVLNGIGAEPAVTADPRGDVVAIGRAAGRPRVFVLSPGRRWCRTRSVGPASEAAIATSDGQSELLWHRARSRAMLATTERGCRPVGA